MYPPRFKFSVNPESHGKKLEVAFKIGLETDDVLAIDDIINIPLAIRKSNMEVPSGKIIPTYMYIAIYN